MHRVYIPMTTRVIILEQRDRKSVETRTQISTFSSNVIPVLTSNSSGARYGIVLCSAARSC